MFPEEQLTGFINTPDRQLLYDIRELLKELVNRPVPVVLGVEEIRIETVTKPPPDKPIKSLEGSVANARPKRNNSKTNSKRTKSVKRT